MRWPPKALVGLRWEPASIPLPTPVLDQVAAMHSELGIYGYMQTNYRFPCPA
jgi:hypothetical protein